MLLFELAATRLGVDPRDIWFVGDRLDADVAGANTAGMTAVWLSGTGQEVAAEASQALVAADWASVTGLTDASSA